jgi:hypothetical protein
MNKYQVNRIYIKNAILTKNIESTSICEIVNEICCICHSKHFISNVDLTDKLIKTDCNHIMCKKCTDKLYETTNKCPMCRTNINSITTYTVNTQFENQTRV